MSNEGILSYTHGCWIVGSQQIRFSKIRLHNLAQCVLIWVDTGPENIMLAYYINTVSGMLLDFIAFHLFSIPIKYDELYNYDENPCSSCSAPHHNTAENHLPRNEPESKGISPFKSPIANIVFSTMSNVF